MEGNNQLSFPEEDEDLEALRLAALQSLKRKASNDAAFGGTKDKHFNGSPRGKQKRGKFPWSMPGRSPRNGQLNGWTRNSNLIAVPMVTEEEGVQNKPTESSQLVLPQDRYCKKEKTPEKPDGTSKFDRYDNSDSESDSEEESCKSDEEKPELKRSDSLEALMAELENEIQGVPSKPEPKPKPKKKRKVSTEETKVEKPVVLKENLKPEPVKKSFQNFKRKWPAKPRRHPNFVPHQPIVHKIIQPVVTYAPPPVPSFPPYNPMGFDYVPLVFEAPPPQLPPMHVAPPVYERPLSPLAINTDAFSTCTLAPLSPRSAAFVMENRAIIEKRKRRSYSRSPSPRFRRSKTPKRLSLSPKRRSLSPSPIRKVLPPRIASPKKAPIHDRLGTKPPKTDETDKKKEEKKEDPVLEARRKKFERNEITMTEGVIRLKKPEEENKNEGEEVIDEDALLDGEEGDDSIVLDHKIDALFSDEESDSDNEGRFKTKKETNQKVPVLPFTKLINGSKSDVKNDLKLEENKKRPNERRKRYRSRSPAKSLKKPAKLVKKSEKIKQPMPLASDRKIEIKIRNPTKYEEEEKGRKVEVAKKETEEKDNEVFVESQEEAANAVISEGDLRAQLSRKRAERQKHPLPDVVPSRLLQNALQGVGFRKEKKKKDEASDGKLPIHLRLGATSSPEMFGKKSRKHKNKGSQEQDYIDKIDFF